MHRKGPLEGVRILDFTHVLAGPFATMLLGDMGAEIIKVEPPGTGDSTRLSGPPFKNGESAYFLAVNRNKRSICVDLKKKEGVGVVRRLIKNCDVMAENFRPGVMDRLGLGYDEMKKIRPDLIYASLSAFGNRGPYRDKPGYELIIQGLTGLINITTEPGRKPAKIQIQVVDLCGGMFLAYAVMGALYHKKQTGQGQRVETSLLESTVTMMANLVGIYFMTGKVPTGMGSRNPQAMPSQAFKTRDSHVVVVSVGRHWERFCRALGKPDWITDENLSKASYRIEHYDDVERMIEEITVGKKTEEWLELFDSHQVAAGPVNTVEGLFQDAQFHSMDLVTPMDHPKAGPINLPSMPWRLSQTPGGTKLPPPMLGEHTVQVLAEGGFSREEIGKLKEKGVIHGTTGP